MARPPALRVFWPEPRLPRLEAGSGYLSEDDAAPPREVLVGWWRETSAGADAVVAGAVPSTSDASLDDILLAVVDASAGSHPGAIPLGPLRVLGEVVPAATPPRARGAPPSDAARVASPRRTPRRKVRDRAPSASAAAAAPADDVELWIAATEPSTEPSRTPRRSHRAAFPEFREVRWRGDDLLKRSPRERETSGGAIRVLALAYEIPDARAGALAPAASSPKKKKKTPPPDPDPDSDPNSSPPSLAWAESATLRVGRLTRGGEDVARRGDASAERRLPARVARFVRDAAARAADLLEVRCVPGLRSRHAWRLAPEDPPEVDVSNKAAFASEERVTRASAWTRRNLCEVFASAKVLRSRLRWLAAGCDAPLRAACAPAAVFGRFAQCALDFALGWIVASALSRARRSRSLLLAGDPGTPEEHASENALSWSKKMTSWFFGDDGLILGGATARNAAWISRGSPLGVKLHRPLANALGAAALFLVRALGEVEAFGSARTRVGFVRVVEWAGRVGGFGAQAAVAADLATFLTVHVASLHVYSSLLVTAQWRAATALAKLAAFGGGGEEGEAGDARRETSGGRRSRRPSWRRPGSPTPPKSPTPPRSPTPPSRGALLGLSRVEATALGVLALTPVALLFPTTLAFYLSYLALHASTVAVRAALVAASAFAREPLIPELCVRLAAPRAFRLAGGFDAEPLAIPAADDDEASDANEVNEDANARDAKKDESPPRVRFVRVDARVASVECVFWTPFRDAFSAWAGDVARAVVGACASLGRLPVALAPFEPER